MRAVGTTAGGRRPGSSRRPPRRLLAEAAEDLARRDPRLAVVIEEAGPPTFAWGRPRVTHFEALARSIVFQQLAGRAAAAIHARFLDLFDGAPTPEAVAALPEGRLRPAGLSGAKAAAVRDLAVRFLDGTVAAGRLHRLDDEEVVRELVRVRGIGRWTAEMFLMFQLGRLDVWPVDDLGVRRGFARIHDLDPAPTPRELAPLGDAYRPYRSVAAWYCWRAVETVLPETVRPSEP